MIIRRWFCFSSVDSLWSCIKVKVSSKRARSYNYIIWPTLTTTKKRGTKSLGRSCNNWGEKTHHLRVILSIYNFRFSHCRAYDRSISYWPRPILTCTWKDSLFQWKSRGIYVTFIIKYRVKSMTSTLSRIREISYIPFSLKLPVFIHFLEAR